MKSSQFTYLFPSSLRDGRMDGRADGQMDRRTDASDGMKRNKVAIQLLRCSFLSFVRRFYLVNAIDSSNDSGGPDRPE